MITKDERRRVDRRQSSDIHGLRKDYDKLYEKVAGLKDKMKVIYVLSLVSIVLGITKIVLEVTK
jgi:hypothetical protein